MDEITYYLRRSCLGWEKLRIVYNLVLVGVYFCFTDIPRVISHGDRLFFTVLFFCVANAFYNLGPVWEIANWVFLNRRMNKGRYVLFGLLLLVPILVTVFV